MVRILTWNILAPLWFDEYQNITYGLNISNKKKFHEMRLQNIINSIKIIKPDIICLQEITREWLKVIKKELKYKTYYSFITNKNKAQEGIATLCKPDTKIIKTIKFIDSENEPNIYTYIEKNNKKYLY